MPVPSAISDLSTTPASNSPAGSETPSSTDDYLRTLAAFIKQLASETHIWCGTASGTANALVLTPSSAITAYTAGKTFHFQAASNNSGATTVSVSGLGSIDVEASGVACVGGEIIAGKWYGIMLSSATKAQLSSVGSTSANLTTAFNEKRSTVALTATTSPIWTAGVGKIIDGTGTPTITDFPAAPQAGSQREIYPAAGTVLTNGGNISVQGAATITAAAGDKWVITAVTTTTFYVEVSAKSGNGGYSGQCRLTKSGANIVLSPFNGNKLTINGSTQSVPSAGVSLAPTGLTVSTLYYVYAYMSGATMTLEASTTGHSTDANTGMEIKTGDATRTLVGMVRPITGPAFADSLTQMFVLSWFNQVEKSGYSFFTASRSTTSPTYVELSTEIRVEFLSWGSDVPRVDVSGRFEADSTSVLVQTVVSLDGNVRGEGICVAQREGNTLNMSNPLSLSFGMVGVSEGHHVATILGLSSVSAYAAWAGAAAAGSPRCSLNIKVRG